MTTKEIYNMLEFIKNIGIIIVFAFITNFIANIIIILELPKIRRNTEYETEEEPEE